MVQKNETETVLRSLFVTIWLVNLQQMILLEKEHYWKLRRHLNQVSFNHLFAIAVIDHTVSGRVYVDDVTTPGTFYIVHNYGMSLLGGDHSNLKFNEAFREYALNLYQHRTSHEWMQVSPNHWNAVLRELFNGALIKAADNKENIAKSVIELNTRVNFLFEKEKFALSSNERTVNNPKIKVVQNTKEAFDRMKGSVVPKAFWNSSADFQNKGVAFSLFHEEELAATSFSSFLAPGKLELGIETVAKFRGQGFAEKVCAALIDHCLERRLEPIWACRLENTGSFKLADKLGFVPSMELPYFRLSN